MTARAVAVAIVAAAAIARLAACFNDLWLDEIWSLARVRAMSSWLDVFALHHDNNHFLNSLWMRAVPEGAPDPVFRLPAWIAGAATVALGGAIVARQVPASPPAFAIGAAVTGASYMLIHYASEARGYGPAVFFSLAALWLALRGIQRADRRSAIAFQAALLLALLAHAVALHVLAGLLAWRAFHWLRRRPDAAAIAREIGWWHALPVAAAIALYFGHLRHLDIGGGPDHALLPVVTSTAAFTLGAPQALALPLALLVAAAGIAVLARRGGELWVAYAVGIFVAPALILLASEHPLLFERYFIASAVLLALLAGTVLAALWQHAGWRRSAAAVALVAFVAGNAFDYAALLRDGRGQYRTALGWVAAQTDAPQVTWSSDHAFRNELVIRYHAARLPLPKTWAMVEGPPWQGPAPQWLFAHSQSANAPAEPTLHDPQGNTYAHVRTFPCGPMSGWRWFVLRRQ